MPDVSLDEFAEEVAAFFDANAKVKMSPQEDGGDKPFVWGEGDDDIGLFAGEGFLDGGGAFGFADFVFVSGEDFRQESADAIIVVNNQDVGLHKLFLR